MSTFFVISSEKPDEQRRDNSPRISHICFAKAFRQRWPISEHRFEKAGNTPELSFCINDSNGANLLHGNLFDTFVSFNAFERQHIVEFALWYCSLMAPLGPLYLYLGGFTSYIELAPDISPQQLSDEISVKGYW